MMNTGVKRIKLTSCAADRSKNTEWPKSNHTYCAKHNLEIPNQLPLQLSVNHTRQTKILKEAECPLPSCIFYNSRLDKIYIFKLTGIIQLQEDLLSFAAIVVAVCTDEATMLWYHLLTCLSYFWTHWRSWSVLTEINKRYLVQIHHKGT